MNPLQINIIYPASRASEDTLNPAIIELKNTEFKVQIKNPSKTGNWQFYAGTIEDRLNDLIEALTDSDCDIILAGRGGYGVSDLLPLIPWSDLKNHSQKTVVGFSDICAFQSALYTILGWPSIHGPMPDTPYWKSIAQDDVKSLLAVLSHKDTVIRIPLDGHFGDFNGLNGPIFGGCLSVLTNLIGTPYLPANLSDHILFFEDVGEHPGQILRYLNQWIQSGVIAGVRHIVMGDFDARGGQRFDIMHLCEEVHLRTRIPVSVTSAFGHCTPNLPVGIGYQGQITNDAFIWKRRHFGFES